MLPFVPSLAQQWPVVALVVLVLVRFALLPLLKHYEFVAATTVGWVDDLFWPLYALGFGIHVLVRWLRPWPKYRVASEA